jgi:hypothetical protein
MSKTFIDILQYIRKENVAIIKLIITLKLKEYKKPDIIPKKLKIIGFQLLKLNFLRYITKK